MAPHFIGRPTPAGEVRGKPLLTTTSTPWQTARAPRPAERAPDDDVARLFELDTATPSGVN